MIDAARLIIDTARMLPPVEVQNRLMKLPDRDIALSMLEMGPVDRELLLSFLSVRKAQRIREELALHERLTIRPEHFRRAAGNVVAALRGPVDARPPAQRSYLRPVRGSVRRRPQR